MKISIISFLFFLVPFCLFAQGESLGKETLSVIKNSQIEEETYYLVTPLLLRQETAFNQAESNPILLYNNKYATFLSSLVIPGSGQISNKNWLKAGLFAAVEAASIFLFFDYRDRAESGERKFEEWTNKHWSVVQYSEWLVNYHDVHGFENPRLNELRTMVNGVDPAFDNQKDWGEIDLNVLREVERNTPYVTSDMERANNFSHVLPDYGSQQYYELVSKYYQYQAGWKDYYEFHNSLADDFYNRRFLIDRNGAYASPFFFEGAELANEFNTDFRRSGYFISVLIANHIFSAFDAFFTFQLKQNKLQAAPSMTPGKQFSLTYMF